MGVGLFLGFAEGRVLRLVVGDSSSEIYGG